MNLINVVDEILICGGMTYTFMKILRKVEIGASVFDEEGSKKGAQNNELCEENTPATEIIASYGVPPGKMGLDIGPDTRQVFSYIISEAKTILWNGPAGVFEWEQFSNGTRALMDAVVAATAEGAISIIGGGDTATAAAKFGAVGRVSHISTGGGASLELLEGKVLPGVEALSPAPTQ
ncbi:unnamed protein product [Caenorhabditis auriculariae]|uniref:Phosphoglycerate kinase n=1 Tax=Caenorhabditis auriculariae TaxID=2777116 RepID=A0A8S1HTG0_9PELO|nr:unnamed protein product [Caenorhabditis auriculariae]